MGISVCAMPSRVIVIAGLVASDLVAEAAAEQGKVGDFFRSLFSAKKAPATNEPKPPAFAGKEPENEPAATAKMDQALAALKDCMAKARKANKEPECTEEKRAAVRERDAFQEMFMQKLSAAVSKAT